MISGSGTVRHEGGTTPIEAGDAFIFKPGEPHQLLTDGPSDMLVYVIADNPVSESTYYPDSNKWAVRSPERRLVVAGPSDYYEGEE